MGQSEESFAVTVPKSELRTSHSNFCDSNYNHVLVNLNEIPISAVIFVCFENEQLYGRNVVA